MHRMRRKHHRRRKHHMRRKHHRRRKHHMHRMRHKLHNLQRRKHRKRHMRRKLHMQFLQLKFRQLRCQLLQQEPSKQQLRVPDRLKQRASKQSWSFSSNLPLNWYEPRMVHPS